MIQYTCPNPAMLYSVPMCGTHLFANKVKGHFCLGGRVLFFWLPALHECDQRSHYQGTIFLYCNFAIELPKGMKNLVVLVDSIFEKKLFYKAEELAESTHTHQWNKGFEIQPDLCTVVSYLTHCHIRKMCKLFNKNYF